MVSDNSTAEELQFPAGLRVLAVDDDRICLRVLEELLRKCLYRVTTCLRAVDALKLLRENKDGFDLVISDVHMPAMDGFKLLELVGLEMDLPVIMTSANGETGAVMKGIQHGACDYLLKPVRLEELKNIWQHVVRKKKKSSNSSDDKLKAGAGENNGKEGVDGGAKNSKKRKDGQDEDEENEQENEDPSSSKKPRVVWTVDLHQKFVNAVHQLGINKAVPKRVLELMDIPGLTRENVASHLQKYRLYLRRISGVAHQTTPDFVGYGGVGERYLRGATDLGEFRSHLTPHTLMPSFPTGILNNGNLKSPDTYFIAAVNGHAINNGLQNRGLTNGHANMVNSNHGVIHSAHPGGLEFKRSQITPQLDSNGSGVLSALPLFSSVNMDNNFTTDNNNTNTNNSSLILQMVQNQAGNEQIGNDPKVISDHLPLVKVNGNKLNMLVSDSRTRLENSFNSYSHVDSVAPFGRSIDSRVYDNTTQTIVYHNSFSSSIPAHVNDVSLPLSAKSGIPSSNHISSAPNLVAGSATMENWDAWRGSQYPQATTIGTLQEPCAGWVPKLENDLNEGAESTYTKIESHR